VRAGAPRDELFAALLRTLTAAPAVLVFEDLHWADEATIDLVRFSAAGCATRPPWSC